MQAQGGFTIPKPQRRPSQKTLGSLHGSGTSLCAFLSSLKENFGDLGKWAGNTGGIACGTDEHSFMVKLIKAAI